MSQRASWATDEKGGRWITTTVEADVYTKEALRRDNCLTFHDMMIAAMLQNGLKYGDIQNAYPDRVDAVRSLRERLDQYELDGNVRWLVDVGNFAMLEFTLPRHPKAHVGPDKSIGRVVPGVGEFTEKSNAEINAAPVEQKFSRAGD